MPMMGDQILRKHFSRGMALLEKYPPIRQGGDPLHRPGAAIFLRGPEGHAKSLHALNLLDLETGAMHDPYGLVVSAEMMGDEQTRWSWLSDDAMLDVVRPVRSKGPGHPLGKAWARTLDGYTRPGVLESYFVISYDAKNHTHTRRLFLILDEERLLAINSVVRLTGMKPKYVKLEETNG